MELLPLAHHDTRPVRRAAKLLVRISSADQYVLVAGERPLDQGGWINLIGGGIERGESPLAALEREVAEESPSFRLSDLDDISYVDTFCREVENRRKERFMAVWEVFCARLPLDKWPYTPDQKTSKQQLFSMSAGDISAHQRVSELAKQAAQGAIAFQDTASQRLAAEERQIVMEIFTGKLTGDKK